MEVVIAFVVALVISALFSSRYRSAGSYVPLLVFFVILFMAILAGQFWLTPFGPVFWGISWIPLFFVGLIFAFVLVAAAPFPGSRRKTVKEEIAEEEATGVAIGIFTWLLIIALIIAVVTGYYKRTDEPVRDIKNITSKDYDIPAK
jgi:small-conductance mechanosensitive channel